MANESSPSDMRNVWQSQRTEGIHMSMEEIRGRARKFQKRIHWRNGREYVAALAVSVYFGFELWRAHGLMTQVGFGLLIAGLAYMVWQLHRRGSARDVPAELGLANGVDFYRRELARQRDLVRSAWSWYIAPVVPGLLLVTAGFARTNPRHVQHPVLSMCLFDAFAAVFFLLIWQLNRSGARRLQKRIDELDALQGLR